MKQTVVVILLGLVALLAFKNLAERPQKVTVPAGPSSVRRNPETAPQAVESTYRLEEFVSGLTVPWSIVFTAPGRILVSERGGAVRIIEKGKLIPGPLVSLPDVYVAGEAGLLGLAVDPGYQSNKMVYAAYAYRDDAGVAVKVVRFIDMGDRVSDTEVVIDRIPAGNNHAGTRLRFGPDGKLYVTTGEGGQGKRAQDKGTLSGKILRIEPDGSVPSDNPVPGSPVFALGLRNSQGLDFDPLNGTLWVTDHGPSVFDGPPGGDEINRIEAGGNYGWPVVSHERKAPGMTDPAVVYTPAVAPASLLFYKGSVLPGYRNDLFFGGLRGTGLYRVRLSEDRKRVASSGKLPYVDVGRVRDVVEGPDGYIYFTTSNRDGRGKPESGDDKIFRIVPGS